jgi:hypothetical protein
MGWAMLICMALFGFLDAVLDLSRECVSGARPGFHGALLYPGRAGLLCEANRVERAALKPEYLE